MPPWLPGHGLTAGEDFLPRPLLQSPLPAAPPTLVPGPVCKRLSEARQSAGVSSSRWEGAQKGFLMHQGAKGSLPHCEDN